MDSKYKSLSDVVIPKYMEKFLRFSESLRELTEDNLEENIINYKNQFFTEDMDEIATLLIMFSRKATTNKKTIQRLIYKFCIDWRPFPKSLLTGLKSSGTILPYADLIRMLYQKGVWTNSEIKATFQRMQGFSTTFAPELDRQHDLSKEYRNQINELKKENWSIYNQILEYGYEKDTIGYFIKFDDIEALQSKIKEKDFDFNAEILLETFSKDKKPLINISAYYGSLKCFKYLIENGAKLTPLTLDDAIRGGNEEIINMCIANKCETRWALLSVVRHNQNQLFEKARGLPGAVDPSVCECINGCNYRALLFYLHNGTAAKNRHPPLCTAARCGYLSMCRALVEAGERLKDTVDASYNSLHLACFSRHFYVAAYLVEVTPPGDINALTDSKETALDIAEARGDEETARYLRYKGGQPGRLVSKK